MARQLTTDSWKSSGQSHHLWSPIISFPMYSEGKTTLHLLDWCSNEPDASDQLHAVTLTGELKVTLRSLCRAGPVMAT